MKKLDPFERFEIESALNFRCWRIRLRPDRGKALLHNVTGLRDKVTALDKAGLLLESGEQEGFQYALTPDREELTDISTWQAPESAPEVGSFTQLFAGAGLSDVSATPDQAPGTGAGELTSAFLKRSPQSSTSPISAKTSTSAEPKRLDPNDVPTVLIPAPPNARRAQTPAKSESDPLLERRWTGRVAVPPQTPAAPTASGTQPEEPESEFTRLFAAPAQAAAAQAPPTQAPPAQAPPAQESPQAQRSANPILSPEASAAGEFTRLFRAPAPVLVEESQTAKARSQPTPPHKPPAVPASGEFTRLFRAPAPTPANEPQAIAFSPEPVPPQPLTQTAAPPPTPASGEFTRLFRAPSPTVPPGSQGQRSTLEPEPGGFTKLFEKPNLGAPTPAAESRAFDDPAPRDSEVGGLTSLFQAPPKGAEAPAQRSPSGTPVPHSPSASPDFDKFFSSPLASNQESVEARLHSEHPVAPERPMAHDPGQFTRLFGRDEVDAAIGGSAKPTAPTPTATPTPASTSLFPALPMERTAGAAAASAQPSSAEPISGPSEFTRVFQRPPAAAPAPQSAPAPSSLEDLKAKKSGLSKVWKIVLSILAAVAAALVAFFVFYKKHH